MALEASEIAVRIRLLGGSAFEKEAQGVAKSTEAIGAAGRKANAGIVAGGSAAHNVLDKTGSKLKKVGSQVTSLGRSLTMAGIPLAYLGFQAVKTASQFQSSMTLLYSQAGLPRKNIQGLTKDIQKLSTVVGQTPDALAKGAFPIVSSGTHDPRKITSLLRIAGIMAAVGHDTVDNTASALTSILNTGFHPKGGAPQVAAYLEAAVGAGKMHLPDLTASLNTSILPLLKLTGVSLPQGLATLAALTRQGMDASSVFSRTRLTLTSVASPTAAAQKAMKILGFNNPLQLAGDLRHGGMLAMLNDLKVHSALFSPTDRLDLIARIFGKSRGIGNIGALLQAYPQLQQIASQVTGATPALLQRHFGAAKETTAFKLQQAQAAFYKAMIKLGDAISKVLLPLLPGLVRALTSVVNWFGKLSPQTQKFLMILAGAVIVGGPIALFVGGLITAGGHILTFIGWLTKSEVAMGAEGAGTGLVGAIGGLRGGFLGLLGPIGLLAATIMLATNPKIAGPIGKAEDSVIGFLTGTKHFGANTSGNQWGSYAGYSTPPPGYAAFLRAHPGVNFTMQHQALLNQWWSTRHEPAALNHPMPRLAAGDIFGGVSGAIRGIGSEVAGGLQIVVPVTLDTKVIATAVAKVNRQNLNRR